MSARISELSEATLEDSDYVYISRSSVDYKLNLQTAIAGGTLVKTYAQLVSAISALATRIVLGANISVTGAITFVNTEVLFNGYVLSDGGGSIIFNIDPHSGRKQIFSGWSAGDITGSFGSIWVYPEWWGLIGTTSSDGQHDIAIQSALSSRRTDEGGVGGTRVSLADRIYYLSKPLIFDDGCRLEGAGATATKLIATTTWAPDSWSDSTFWEYWKTEGSASFTTVSNSSGNILLNLESGATNFLRVAYKTVINSAATASSGTKTSLNVTTSEGIYAGDTITVVSTSAGDTEYDASFVVDSIPDSTHVVINKSWSDDMTGNLYKIAGQADSVTISGTAAGIYDGVWAVTSIPAHNQVVLAKLYTATASGTMIPVTLDSVMVSGANCTSALIMMGTDSEETVFGSGIRGLSISGYYAVRAHPTKRVSLISWPDWVEELSPIEDVLLSTFSGFAIGSDLTTSANGITTVNGLTVKNFWITDACRRGAVAIFMPASADVFSIRDGTIDVALGKASSAFATSYVSGEANYAMPSYKQTWGQFGILAAGSHSVIDNVHIEGTGNAIHVYSWAGPGGVSISNIDTNHLMSAQMGYYDDVTHKPTTPSIKQSTQESQDSIDATDAWLFHHSVIVSIGRTQGVSSAAHAYDSSVSVRNIRSHGQTQYLIRDYAMGIQRSAYTGRYPWNGIGGVTCYDRGRPYGPDVVTAISAAASASAGAKTSLTVDSSTGIIAGNSVDIVPTSAGDSEYNANFVVDSVTDSTHIVINKSWTDDMTGHLYKTVIAYDPLSPATDKTYYLLIA